MRTTAGFRFVRLALDAVAKANAALAKRLKARRMTWPSVLCCFRVSRCISRVARPSHGRLADAVGEQKPAISPAASCRAGRAEWATPRARNQWESRRHRRGFPLTPSAAVPAWCAKADAAAVGSPSAQAVQLDVGALVRTWIERLFADALPCARSLGGTVGGGCGLCGARARARLCVCECL